MCGIVACVSNHCATILLEGLSQLKNRGYDSAGMATLTDKIRLDKFAGKDAYTQLMSQRHYHVQSTLGIAHTRWATHGAKTDANAHPHLSMCGKFAMVHNGILENYSALKTFLEEKGFIFTSQTDSEVIAHLVSFYAQTQPILVCIQTLNQVLQGSWAIAILCVQTQALYCTGSPLLIGYNEDQVLIVSEKSGFCQNITHYFVLNPKDICKIDQHRTITTLDTYPIQKLTQEKALHLVSYPHWTLKEIHEQPASALRAMEGRVYPDFVYLQEFLTDLEDLLSIDHLILLGCGSSYFAGQHGVFFLKELCDFTTVQLFEGAEFCAQDIPKKGKTALLLLSQSGETKDLHRCIALGREHGLKLLGLINVEDSWIAREVDCVCYVKAGREVGVASTKSYTSQVICLSLIALWFAQQKQLNPSTRTQYLEDLHKLSQDIQRTLHLNPMEPLVTLFQDKEHCFVLGKGKAESVAKEGALKIKEISYVHSEGYSTSSLKHGPFSLLDDHFPVLLIDSTKAENAYQEIKTRHAPIVWISPKDRSEDPFVLRIQENQTFGDLLAIIPLQLLAYHLSVARGIDPDYPKNLAKVVTVD